jgi:hypothetical protein
MQPACLESKRYSFGKVSYVWKELHFHLHHCLLLSEMRIYLSYLQSLYAGTGPIPYLPRHAFDYASTHASTHLELAQLTNLHKLHNPHPPHALL